MMLTNWWFFENADFWGWGARMSIYGTLAVSNPLYLWIIIFKSRILLHSLQRLVLSKFFCMMWVLFPSIYYSYHFIFIYAILYEWILPSVGCKLCEGRYHFCLVRPPAQHLADMLHIYQNIKISQNSPGYMNLYKSGPLVCHIQIHRKGYTCALAWRVILFSNRFLRLFIGLC